MWGENQEHNLDTNLQDTVQQEKTNLFTSVNMFECNVSLLLSSPKAFFRQSFPLFFVDLTCFEEMKQDFLVKPSKNICHHQKFVGKNFHFLKVPMTYFLCFSVFRPGLRFICVYGLLGPQIKDFLSWQISAPQLPRFFGR